MQPQSSKQLLRNIGSNILSVYLANRTQRQDLGYPLQCQSASTDVSSFQTIRDDCLALKCLTVSTKNGQKLCRVVLVSLKEKPIYDRWFGIGFENQVLDLRVHQTGINNQLFQQKIQKSPLYGELDRKEIQTIIENKVIIGHDLSEDLKYLGITHQAFIDTVSLIPHHFGLPFKNKIKDLAFKYLKKHIQWSGPDIIEDSIACLQIVQKHIQDGRGTIQVQACPRVEYQNNFHKIIKDAQLNEELILMFVLRGSRALGIQMEGQYKSDWDYIVVYNVKSELDGRLIKLPNVDISFFDKQSFDNHMKNNDISYIQSFFIDDKFTMVNTVKFPPISLQKLRGSLGFHLNKSRLKIKRFQEEVKNDRSYNWKILKAYHLQLRFIDLFLQIFEFCKNYEAERMKKNNIRQNFEEYPVDIYEMKKKIDIKKMNSVWSEIKSKYEETRDMQKLKANLDKRIQISMSKVNQKFPKFKAANCRQKQRQGFIFKQRMRQKSLCKEKFSLQQSQSSTLMKSIRNVPNFEVEKCERENVEIPFLQVSNSSLGQKNIQKNLQKSKLSTVNFLRSHQLSELSSYKINWKRHKVFPNLIQFHYMMSADFRQQIAIECRGLILDQDRNYQIVAYPYNKFFDYNDPSFSQSQKIDWKSANVFEKKDGSIAFLYFYNGLWNVASASVPDGENHYCFAKKQTTTQFKNQFWSIFHSLKFQVPEQADKNKTFIFQLMSKNHTIVVKREVSQLCLHGVRNIETLSEEDHFPYGKKYNWVVAEPLEIQKQNLTIERLAKLAEDLDPLLSEGFVVCDHNWRRIKIKSSKYVRINWLGELNLGFNKDPRKYILIEIIMSGEAEVFCKYCPQWSHVIKQFLTKIQKLNKQIIQIYEPIKQLDQKEFAKSINKYNSVIRSFLFSVRSNPAKYFGKVQYCIAPKRFYDFLTQYM